MTAFPIPSTALRSMGITPSASLVRSGKLSVMPFIMSMPSIASSFLTGRKLLPNVTMKRVTALPNISSRPSAVLVLTISSFSMLPIQSVPLASFRSLTINCGFWATFAAASIGHLPNKSLMVERRWYSGSCPIASNTLMSVSGARLLPYSSTDCMAFATSTASIPRRSHALVMRSVALAPIVRLV